MKKLEAKYTGNGDKIKVSHKNKKAMFPSILITGFGKFITTMIKRNRDNLKK